MDWVTATQLVQWSDTRRAQELLPLVVRRLILASANHLKFLAMPGGDSIFRTGWDGRVHATSTSWPVPDGVSVWEIGTSKDVAGKFTEDFDKRTADPKGTNKANTTLVLVTSRRWPDTKGDKAEWSTIKAEEGGWENVLVLDADDLEAWLSECAAVAVWLAQELGAPPVGLEALDTFWRRSIENTEPNLTSQIILAGREDDCDKLRDFAEGEDNVLRLKADTWEESVLILAAWAKREPGPAATLLFANAVVVYTEEVWRQMSALRRPLFLIPAFLQGSLGLGGIADRGHWVAIPLGWDAGVRDKTITASMLDREKLETALTVAGLSAWEARYHAANSGRSLQVLIWRLATDADRRTPSWAKGVDAQALVPLVFAGRWQCSNVADQEVIGCFAGQSYDDVEKRFSHLINIPDSPLRQYGDVIVLTSPADAWSLLASQVTPQSWERYQSTLIAILKQRDPKLDLPSESRWAAPIYGKEFRESGLLRNGLTEQLARLTGIEDRLKLSLVPGPENIAACVLDKCLKPRDSAERWMSIQVHLPELAEASPDLFLDCLESLVDNPSEASQIFDTSSSITSTSPHIYVMWAIERLRWLPGCLRRCTEVLVRLAALDPGDNSSPRPASTFAETFHLLAPENNEPFATQYAILKSVGSKWADEAWPLLVSLLERDEWRTVKHGPRFRDFVSATGKPKTYGDLWARIEQVLELLSALAGNDQQRWIDVFDKIGNIHEAGRAMILDRIEQVISEIELPHQSAIALYQRMSAAARHHRAFADTNWAMPEDVLQRIESLADKIRPSDPVEVHRWLFADHWPDHAIRPDDEALAETRAAAFEEVLQNGGYDAVVRLAETTSYPGFVGEAAASVFSDPAETADFLDFFLSRLDGHSKTVARCFVSAFFRSEGLSVTEFVAQYASGLEGEKFGRFAQGLPSGTETWDIVEAKGDSAAAAYWQGAGFFHGDDTGEITRATRSLLKHDQVFAAIRTVGMAKGKSVPSELVVGTLKRVPEAIDKHGDPTALHNLSFDVTRLFECLDENDDIPDEDLVRLEFEFLPMLEHAGRGFPGIRRRLANDPDFFIELIRLQYKDETGACDSTFEDMDESRRQVLGRILFDVLHDFDSLPGLDGKDQNSEGLLRSWIDRALKGADAVRRRRVAELNIGDGLARAPEIDGQPWPPDHVCNVLEEFWSEDLGRGFQQGAYNKLGVRAVDEGRADARRAAQYLKWAAHRSNSHPHVARLLQRIAKSFQADADMHKRDAELRRHIE